MDGCSYMGIEQRREKGGYDIFFKIKEQRDQVVATGDSSSVYYPL